ncbi:MAG: DUF3769 domain-containing protein [Oscillatoriaceae cyanobacterium]
MEIVTLEGEVSSVTATPPIVSKSAAALGPAMEVRSPLIYSPNIASNTAATTKDLREKPATPEDKPTADEGVNFNPSPIYQRLRALAAVAPSRLASSDETPLPSRAETVRTRAINFQPKPIYDRLRSFIPSTGVVSQTPPPATPTPTPTPAPTPQGTPAPIVPPTDAVEVRGDKQEYNSERQIVTAAGNAFMRFRGAILDAEWLQVNLQSRIAVAEGNVDFRTGEQRLQGERLEYDIEKNQGDMSQARGQVYLPTAGTDFGTTLPTDVSAGIRQEQPISDVVRAAAPPPPKNVTSAGDVTFGASGGRGAGVANPQAGGGQINRLRFESANLTFTGDSWRATNVRLTNDPFSPPELEVRADWATFRNLSPLQDEIVAKRPKLVFDGWLAIPLLKERVILDRTERDPSLIRFGYDGGDRGGLYAESTVDVRATERFQLTLMPQFFIQKSLLGDAGNFSDLFGLKAKLNATLTPTTTFQGSAVFNTINLGETDTKLRSRFSLNQKLGTHNLAAEYSYRDRVFNGSLGYKTVHQNAGIVLTSSPVVLGNTGIQLSYNGSIQHIEADTDRLDLLEVVRENNRTDLNRFQATAALSRGLLLWKGTTLPPTPTQGLRYSSSPVLPYVQMFGGLTGVASAYSNGDTQNFLSGSIGIQGQFGHFSRDWLDYTAFQLIVARIWNSGASPFLFDRLADVKVLAAGFTQQLYGPVRLGIQAAYNLDTKERISTDYILEYQRRTYGISIRYNPEKELGAITLRLSDFNWVGGGQPFSP